MDALSAYNKINDQAQDALLKNHALLVKRIAHHMQGRLPHSVQFDDLMQAGMMGLLEAVRHYDENKGASFETYAGIRIRGYMLDEVRRNDWVPRSVHRNSRIVAKAVKKVENRLGREAKDSEIAEELNLTLNEYYQLLKDSAGSQIYGFDDLGISEHVLQGDKTDFSEPQTAAMQEDMLNNLSLVIEELPAKEQLVLSLYYEQELNLKEVGKVLGVSESRISQILTQAIVRIKSRL